MKTKIFYIILGIFICFQSSSQIWAVPKLMPNDFSINYSFNGGMSPTYKTILLKAGECTCKFRMNYDDNPTEYTFQLQIEELSALYTQLRNLRAFSLKSKKANIYDRGGESVTYNINGKSYQVNNSGMSFIIDSHSKAFSKSVLLITTLAAKYQP